MSFSWQNVGTNLRVNSPAILTGLTVAGVVGTAYLSIQAGMQAKQELIRRAEENPIELTNAEKFKCTWRYYIPPFVVGGITITTAIASNRISARRAAALAGAASLSELAFQEYRNQVMESIGKQKATAVQDAIVQKRVDANPPTANDTKIIFTDGGDMLCYDVMTDRYFHSNMEALRKAQNDINQTIINGVYASLNDWYRIIGLPTLDMGDEIGWSTDNLVEVAFSSGLTPEDQGPRKPYLAVIFDHRPTPEYNKPW